MRVNLNTTHSLTDPTMDYPTNALPVVVDLNWTGQIISSGAQATNQAPVPLDPCFIVNDHCIEPLEIII